MDYSVLLIFPLLFFHFQLSSAQNGVESAYWFPESEFAASNIDSTLFTHLFCAFADLDPQTNQVTVSPSKISQFSQFTKTVQLKNPNVKTLLSIGGGNANKTVFAIMASQSSYRKLFIDSSIKLARNYGFYGLDLDWEYPEASSQMENYGSLLSEWRSSISSEARTTGKSPLLLTAAINYVPRVNGLDYPVQTVVNSLDWLNLMAYDFYDPTRPRDMTKAHAALYDPVGQASGSYGTQAWINAGANAKKLVLGFPYYGYAWRLVSLSNHGLNAPANGPVGPDNGAMSYVSIKGFISSNSASVVYNASIGTNYCYSGTTWIGYDDVPTISAKVTYAKQKGLLGYFAWHVANDNNWALSKQAKQVWEA